ncbi:hypothetical protein B9G98_00008 [Wickerhamiella sorbophila]|uniref:Thioesterase domain-containing protein n=1 Tax=Wickerhamiella sorbophila TaxID=45607 RepID=A0A2T0FBK6_9ASCO|nr:hypothetical protein B9G98_00008 [Wickerhamiella sorbophila]PRT52388.1 hypothetical protein B9G98_00008 [Wickerhamiella sorbophila]
MVTLKEKVQHALDLMSFALDSDQQVFFHEIHANPPRVLDVRTNDKGQPVVQFEFNTKSFMRNHMDATHGGALTTILDWYSSMAAVADERYWSKEDRLPTVQEIIRCGEDMGLSRSLKSQFMRPVPVDTTVLLECRVLSNGKKSSCISMTIYDEDGRPLYEGLHDKIKLYKPIETKL